MIQTYQRNATQQDFRDAIKGRGSVGQKVLKIVLPFSIFLFVLTYLLAKSLLAALIISIVFFVGSIISGLLSGGGLERLDFAPVEVIQMNASRVVGVQSQSRNVPAWCFFSGDGRVLLLTGQWLKHQIKFPSLSFHLHLWKDNLAPIRVDSLSGPIRPEDSNVVLRNNYRMREVEIFSGTPDTLQADLDKAFIPRA